MYLLEILFISGTLWTCWRKFQSFKLKKKISKKTSRQIIFSIRVQFSVVPENLNSQLVLIFSLQPKGEPGQPAMSPSYGSGNVLNLLQFALLNSF
jgi:hypothetical protein